MIYALHGFLGLPDDWDFLRTPCNAVDLYGSVATGLKPWARAFNESIKDQGSILLGYSMGGRIALHALVDSPTKWKAAVLVSVHPGLRSDSERAERLSRDRAWAERFAHEDWNALLHDWNDQEALKSSKKIRRDEWRFSRRALSECLRSYSLGYQEDLREAIAGLELPILWMAGENDTGHAALSRQISLKHPQSKIILAPDCGHRVPWDNPPFFNKTLHAFLQENSHA